MTAAFLLEEIVHPFLAPKLLMEVVSPEKNASEKTVFPPK